MKEVVVLVCCFVMFSCTQGVVNQITGTWKGGEGNMIYLKKIIEGDSTCVVDSAVVTPNSSFRLKGSVDEIQKMLLTYKGDKEKEIIVAGEPLEVIFEEVTSEKDGKKVTSLNVTCNGGVEQKVFDEGKDLKLTLSLMQLGKMFAASKVDYNDQVAVDSVSRMLHLLDSSLHVSVANYMDSARNNYASTYFFESYLMDNYSFDEVSGFYNNLTDRVKQSSVGINLKKKLDEMGMVSVGGIAPNFKAQTPEGKELSLYDLRGHIVLLDFWASWCGPCMAEMPNVKEIYKKYHDKGLEILGVSLDSKKDAWVKAIQQNELNWNHVSTLSKFDCPIAKRFRVTGIPRMYILDQEGKIVAQDLRGEALKEKMASLFGNEI